MKNQGILLLIIGFATLFMATTQTMESPKMEYLNLKFEANRYTIHYPKGKIKQEKFKGRDRELALNKLLNELGAEGWNLVNSNEINTEYGRGIAVVNERILDIRYIFKRAITK